MPLDNDGSSIDRHIAEFQEHASRITQDLDTLGFASAHAAADGQLQAQLERVLGWAIVARDQISARNVVVRLAESLESAYPWQVVTLDGLVLRWTGELRAGRDQAAQRLVARRQNLARIEAELSALDPLDREVANQLEALESHTQARTAEEAVLRKNIAEAELLERQAALAAQAAANEAARSDRSLADAEREVQTAESELKHAEITAREGAARLQARSAELEHIRAALAESEAVVTEARRAWEEGRATVASLRADEIARKSALETAAQLERRLARDIEDQTQQIGRLRARLMEHEEQRWSHLGAIERLRAITSELLSRIDPLETAIQETRAERARLNAERTEFEHLAARQRASARQAHDVLEQQAIEESRASDRLERLRREAFDWLDESGIEIDEERDPFKIPAASAATASGRGGLDVASDPPDEAVRRRMSSLRRELRSIGPVSQSALAEYTELRDRHAFLVDQTADLEKMIDELRDVMDELQTMMRGAFAETFSQVNRWFTEYFARLFGGGSAELVLSQPDDVLETGVDIVARPPGKRLQPLVSLSGGERALTMVALIFALLKTNPAPFCVLDEVDAALDESNVRRFTDMLRELSERTQFIVVTHNRATMEVARALYGVSMDAHGVSTVVSLRLPEAEAPVDGKSDD